MALRKPAVVLRSRRGPVSYAFSASISRCRILIRCDYALSCCERRNIKNSSNFTLPARYPPRAFPCPLSRACGAGLASEAICRRSSVPSSGSSPRKAARTAAPMPGRAVSKLACSVSSRLCFYDRLYLSAELVDAAVQDVDRSFDITQ